MPEVAPAELIWITGDAIYTTTAQDWTLRTHHSGDDDGRTGRIRLKGWYPARSRTTLVDTCA